MSQLTLEDIARQADKLQTLRIKRRRRMVKPTIGERFARFHAKNPDIYSLLVQLAREAKSDGFKKYSMKTLYEVARWHCRKQSTRDRGFIMNNDFTSHYARMIEEREEDLRGFFEKRRLRSR